MSRNFAVTIPMGLHQGQQFRATLGERETIISVPPNCHVGDIIHVQMDPNQNSPLLNTNYSIRIPRNISDAQNFLFNMSGKNIWITCSANTTSRNLINITMSTEQDNSQIKWPTSIEIPDRFDTIETPKQLLCPITECIMQQPAITPYGITYDYSAINEWLRQKQIDPATNQPLTNKELYPNRSIYSLIEEFILVHNNIELEC